MIGIKEMKKLPDAVFVVDPKEDYNAVLEARKDLRAKNKKKIKN